MAGGSSDVGKGESNPGSFKFHGRRSYILETIGKETRERIDNLREIQRELDELKARFHNERAQLEASFLESCEPLYLKRYNIVNGVVKDIGATTDAVSQDENAARAISVNQTKKQERGKGVPSFWLYALKGRDNMNNKITDQDEEALKHLTDIKWSRIHRGFRLEFHFSSNPFFENPVLTKTYHMSDEDESFIKCVIGTEIAWHPGKCLTEKIAKQSEKVSKKAKPMSIESFFSFFSPPKIPKNLKVETDTVEIIALKFDMEMDFFLGLTIRDNIIPHAVSWFTGGAALEDTIEISTQRISFLDNLPESVKECVESLKLIQENYNALKAKFDEDRASLQAKYLQSCQCLYLQRYKIVNDRKNIDREADEDDEGFLYDKGVPNFWLYALQNNDYVENEITYRDEQALKYLKDIKSSSIDDSKGFKLDFCFEVNPFFTNSILTKTFLMIDEADISLVKDMKGTEIDWFSERCLTRIPIKKKPAETLLENTKSISKTEDCDSFFSFFSAVEVDDTLKRSSQVEHDFYLGSIIRDQIIPRAVSWFTGEAMERDDYQTEEANEGQYLGYEVEYSDDNEDGDDDYEDLDDGLSSDGDDSEDGGDDSEDDSEDDGDDSEDEEYIDIHNWY